ncbi:23S rRNA (uracil(1939)-C(5))-methyltransferase RlmD [Geopsychrobacter electrodiphilus]|uniref:23S rRNA (uracil(1939)-C(5))-methyltransferase RlmD n=1 Tax=Geopsychrobacter electrodiphilus TaxID=225196 RepID=UPI00036D9EE7|nr:23S rRNA (uracil(1939)-C(5))-methyltransferase RlmD [Geopsychrobacter electrodiphilus]
MKRPRAPKEAREILKISIDSLDADGVGQGRYQGQPVSVPGAFPEEIVLAAVEHRGQNRIAAHLSKVLRRNPQRRAAEPCSCAADCLGCPLINMSDRGQLEFKRQRIITALGENGLAEVPVEPTLAAEPTLQYRTSCKLVVARERNAVKIGLYRRGSHQVVGIEDCPLHHPLINRIVKVVSEEITRQKIPVYNPNHQRGLLRYLLIRISPQSGKAMVTFVSREQDLRFLPKLGKWLQHKVPEVIAVHQNINSSTGNVVIGGDTLKLHGQPDLFDRVGNIRLRISPTSFFQVNHQQAARVYQMIREWANLNGNQSALDLYCGVGGISLHLAQDAGQVFGIEVAEDAVRNARANAELNELRNCVFRAGDATEQLQILADELPKLALACLNPPRKGCDQEVLMAMGELAPQQIIYMSCEPESLARDLALLTTLGYKITRVQPVDMFPQTAHVETLVHLQRITA